VIRNEVEMSRRNDNINNKKVCLSLDVKNVMYIWYVCRMLCIPFKLCAKQINDIVINL
jgi:hypothetical protein